MKLSIHLKAKGTQEYYVFVSLSHQSRRVLIATPYIIGAEHVKGGKITNRAKYAEIYTKEILKYEDKLAQVVAPEKLDLPTLKAILTASATERVEVVEFFSNAERVIERIREKPARLRSAKIYEYHLGAFKAYIGRDALQQLRLRMPSM